LIDRIGECVRERTRCWIETVNVSHLCLAARHPELERLFRSADVILADGMPIVWMSRLRGRALRARVTGSDLMEPLARRAAVEGWRIFLCGGEEGVAERAAARLCEAAPGLQIAGTAAPRFPTPGSLTDESHNRALLAQLRAARADIVLVAFGAPKQELWIRHHLETDALPVPVAIGVGGSLDFIAGQQRRAPPWMRRSGIEWIHRMTTQPRRLGPRYAGDLLTFAQLVARELLRGDTLDADAGSAP
jgi:N-acetylglucosaminyldiphosphoundecaprenol N-acetyl-beta-D-mannosaminyltransferase